MRTVRLRLHVPDKPASDVYATLADFERYPELSDAVRSVAVTEVSENRTVSAWEVTFRAGLLRWTEQDTFDPGALSITFRQLEGDAAVFDGSWQCLDAAQGSEIVFSARLDMGIPSLADALEPIAARTLIGNIVSIVRGLTGTAELVASDVAIPAEERVMNLLRTERDTLDSYLPGLDKYLSEVPLLELEQPGCGALAKFRELGGPALLVPAEYAGKGASLLDAVRIQRAVGSRSPSLAVATTMHHFSVASLVELTAAGNGFEWAMLMAIAENSWLLSSGFAEGKPGQHILTPAMRGAPADGGITVSGVKKPCSLTWSMNLMSASVAVADPATGTDRLAVVLIPADSPGIQRAPFWQTTALAAAESDQVTLTEVFVPEALIFYPHDGESMDPVQARGFVWFELLISASYLGAATNLAERVIARGRGSDEDRAGLAIELETMAAALEQVASAAATADDNDALLARALYVRFATEQAIERVVMSAAAALGGMAFIESPEIAYLLGATRALAFHPPSRAAAAGPIARYLAGGPLTL